MPFGELLLVIKGAEMLGLVETPGGDAVLTPLGKRALETSMNDKKALLKEQMLKLKVFQHVVKLLQNADEHEVPQERLVEAYLGLVQAEQVLSELETLFSPPLAMPLKT